MTRILVVETDDDVAAVVADELEADGYEVARATSGPEALQLVCTVPPDLIILDVALREGDGFRVLRTLRDAGNDTPVLVLTVRRTREDKVRAFRLGADDYVTRPFDALELVARVGALLRRARRRGVAGEAGGALTPSATTAPTSAPGDPVAVDDAAAPPADPPCADGPHPIVRFGDVEVNRATRVVRRSGTPISLFPMEYELLIALIDRGGAVATRAELLRELWGPRTAVTARAIDTHIAALRRRLEAVASAPRHILTVRKVGYRFEP
jgi:DNA-binding response OmpR family regulator